MKTKAIYIFILFALGIGGMQVCAQEGTLSNLDKMSLLLAQSQYEIVIDIAEHVYQKNLQHPSDISDEDMDVMRYGVMACWRKHQGLNSYNIDAASVLRTGMNFSQLIFTKALEPLTQLIDAYPSYETMTDSGKMAYLEQLHHEYNEAFPILYFSDQNINEYYARMHHDIAVKNCEILMQGTLENKLSVCGIIDWASPWLWQYAEDKSEVLVYFRILMDMARGSSEYVLDDQLYLAVQIYSTMLSLLPEVSQLILISIQNRTTAYNEAITNFLLAINELKFFTKGHGDAQQYYDTDWRKLKEQLYGNAVALQMFDVGRGQGFVEITADSEIPLFNIVSIGNNGGIGPVSFNSYIARYDRIYFTPIDAMYNTDVVYHFKIYQKFNLYDLTRKHQTLYSNEKEHATYQNETIRMLTDIDYGQGSAVRPLLENKPVVAQMKKDFGKKLKVYSGKKVHKDLFYNIPENVGILHVSTHGIIDETDPDMDLESELQGQNIDSVSYMYSIGIRDCQALKLCLSGYNEDPKNNCLSVYDLLTTTEDFYGLVYLDACNTGRQINFYLASTSFAEAFYIIGATSVIAYINPINEKVAADFAQLFYSKLTANRSFHDVFYETKYEIIVKYNDSELLRRGVNNIPVLDIVLWE